MSRSLIPPSPSAPASQCISVAYATDGIFADLIPYDTLTHINYSFLTPNAELTDTFDDRGTRDHYNGIPTLQTKTHIAMEKAAGMLFCALDLDAHCDLSLLNVIYQTAYRSP